MYLNSQKVDRKVYLWNQKSIIFSSVLLVILILSGFSSTSFVISLFSKPTPTFPTSIPWINTKFECVRTNRTWNDGECWDYEHDMTF